MSFRPFIALVAMGLIAPLSVAAEPPLPHRDDLSLEDRQRIAPLLRLPTDFSKAQAFEAMSGGATTFTGKADAKAFSHISANIAFEKQQDFHLGEALFNKLWVSAPSSTQASDGLGPLYNARSCGRCHIRDGRGHPPEGSDDLATSMFLRLSVPARTAAEKAALARKDLLRIPEPTYGGQLQDFAISGLRTEGRMSISYQEIPLSLTDGETVSLRKPTYTVTDLNWGPLDPEAMMSPRIAPQMIGLGLLEAIHPDDILTQADPADENGDGISGKASYVRFQDKLTLARYGWKASHATVRSQSADAFKGDIGISTPDFPDHWGDCTATQTDCLKNPSGAQPRLGDTEAPDPVMELVTFYAANLAPPKRRNVDDPAVLRGKGLFHQSGCASCHRPSYVTRRDSPRPEHAFQMIWPYTDLLLHDMGEGLSDGRPVGDAEGSEWRTPPLWGIGLTQTVSGHTSFLHDGRARNLLEAILWHGGEAEPAKDAVTRLSRAERADLLRFLESL